jgi:hypothetical protein
MTTCPVTPSPGAASPGALSAGVASPGTPRLDNAITPPLSHNAADAHSATPWLLALREPDAPLPAGLFSANGSDLAQRFGIYRNNVLSACTQALADTFPVCQAWVGEAFFRAMALAYAQHQAPRDRRLAFYGLGFADFVRGFAPAQALPCLSELAALEMARVQAYHAADADSLSAAHWQRALQDPTQLPHLRCQWHPSVACLRSDFAVVSLWQAHQHADAQRDALLASIDVQQPEGALVFRQHDGVLLLPLPLPELTLLRAVQRGHSLGEAIDQASLQAATCGLPDPDIGHCVALMVQHPLVTAITFHGEHP